MILANRGLGDRAFLSLQMRRCVSSSGDYLLPLVPLGSLWTGFPKKTTQTTHNREFGARNIDMDALDLTLDDGWLDPLQAKGKCRTQGFHLDAAQLAAVPLLCVGLFSSFFLGGGLETTDMSVPDMH